MPAWSRWAKKTTGRCKRRRTLTRSAGTASAWGSARRATPCSTDTSTGPVRLRAFGYLRQLEPGDLIKITDSDGNVLSYGVSWIKLYEADTAPLDQIFDQTDDDEVTLITCGGAFDPSVHMYISRWVVRAARLNAD